MTSRGHSDNSTILGQSNGYVEAPTPQDKCVSYVNNSLRGAIGGGETHLFYFSDCVAEIKWVSTSTFDSVTLFLLFLLISSQQTGTKSRWNYILVQFVKPVLKCLLEFSMTVV